MLTVRLKGECINMRKQTKIVAALSATALLALGASAMTFAAGWDNSTGNWQYLGNDGVAVADAWRKSGDYWFYLGSDGSMVTDELVEHNSDFYYVNQDGAMVTNQWVALDSDGYDSDSDDGEAEYRWFYFGSDGKAYRDKNDKLTVSDLKTINGKKYAFDQDGRMLYGWVQADGLTIDNADDAWKNAEYYFGGWNDGSAQSGWAEIAVIDDDGDSSLEWFNFDGNGKKQANKKKTINGGTYYFDEYGRMIEDWSTAVKASGSAFSGTVKASDEIVYVNGDGAARKNQWIWAVPTEDYDESDYNDDEYSWWWAANNGRIFKDGIKKIKGKTYAFDEKGRMLVKLVSHEDGHYYNKAGGTGTKWNSMTAEAYKAAANGVDIYYFSDNKKTDGSRKTGYQNVEFDDDTYQMYFLSNGKAADGYNTKIKKFVASGIVLKANNDDSNYAGVKASYTDGKYSLDGTAVEYTGLDDGAHVLVNAAGTVQKNKKNVKDNNDVYYFTNAQGTVVYAGDKLYTSKSEDHSTEVSFELNGKTVKYYR